MRSSVVVAGVGVIIITSGALGALGGCGGGDFAASLAPDAAADARFDGAGADVSSSVDSASTAQEGGGGADATLQDESSSEAGSGPDSEAGCVIGGTPFVSDAPDPTNSCQSCQPTLSTSSWSNVTDGTACGSGGICRAGACVSGCEIGGVYYAADAKNPNNGCQSCQPATTTSAWSSEADGTACGNGQVCAKGACGTQCDIGGTIYASGSPNPTNACQSCQPGASTTSWTSVATGTTCGVGQVCNGATCAVDCFIAGSLYTSGQANPANACQTCRPGTSTTAFADVANGTGCGTGEVCNAGACGSGCFIGGAVYAPSAPNPANACQSCQPTVTTTAWTNVSGTSCGAGEVCTSGTCTAGCYINGSFYAPTGINPSNPCQACVPGTSTSAWSAGPIPNGTQCGLQCVNTQVDPQNCGACGHGCLGGTCAGGTCQPITLVTGQTSPQGMAVNATSVYWANNVYGSGGGVMTAPLTGGMATTRFSVPFPPYGVAINATDIYWTTNNASGVVQQMPLGGGTATTIASSQSGAAPIVLDSTSIYWLDFGGSVMKAPLNGVSTVTLASGQSVPGSLCVDATSVYWTNNGTGSDGTVMRLPLAGGTAVTLASGLTYPNGIAVDSSSIYWTNMGTAGTIMKASLSGGSPVVLATGQAEPYDIRVDPTGVYWVNQGTSAADGTVMRVALNGGQATTMASAQSVPQGIAIDAVAVYWTDRGSGTIMKVAK